MPEVSAVVPFQDPEVRAGAAKAVPAEPHLHVEKGGKALLEDGALLLRRIAEAVELRLHLQRGELLPILRGVWAQARHGRVLAKCGPAFKLGLASVLSFRLKGPFGSEGEVVARKKGRGAGPGAGPQQQKPAGVAAGGGGWGLLRDSIRRDVEQAISALAFAERLHQKMDTQRRAFLDFPRIMEQLRSGAVERLTTSLSRLYEGGQGFDLQRFLRDLPLPLAALAGSLARGPRSPRGSAACGRVRAETLRRLRRRLGRSATDERPGRPDRGGAGSVPRLDAAGSLRRVGRPRLHQRAAAVEAGAA